MRHINLSWLQGKTAKKYLSSYVLISITPVLLISILFCYNSYLSLVRQQESLAQSRLEQLKNVLDGNISSMESTVNPFESLVQPMDAPHSFEDRSVIEKQLSTYHSNLPFACSIVYYPRYGTKLYTSEGYMDYASFQSLWAFGEELEMVQFYRKLNTISSPTLFTSRKVLDNNPGNYLIYMAPVPLLGPQPAGTLAFIMDKADINNLVINYCGDYSGYFFMFNTFYDVSYGLDRYGLFNLETVSHDLSGLVGTGVIRHPLMGKPFVTFRSVSDTYGFTYVFSVPLSEFRQPVWNQIRLFVWGIGVLVLIMLGLSLYIGSKSFKPIRRLAEDLLHWEPALKTRDLFELLHSHYKTMKTEVDELQSQVDSSKSYNRHRMIENLLYGKYTGMEQLQKAMEYSKIDFRYPHFFAAAIRLERLQKGPDAKLRTFLNPDGFTLKEAIAYPLETDSKNVLAVLINCMEKERSQTIAEALHEHLGTSRQEQITVGVGSVLTDPIRLDMSYYEALTALQEATAPITIYSPGEKTGSHYLCPSAEGIILRQSLSGGNAEVAAQVLKRMTREVRQQHPSFQTSRCFCFFVVNHAIHVVHALGLDFNMESMILSAGHSDLDAFEQTALETLQRLCAAVNEVQRVDEEMQSEAILAYCRQHYMNYDLSADQISDAFHLSDAHIRRIIKEKTGTGLTAYITRLRLEHIKKQLADTEIPIRELIVQVGYTDVSSFTRKFKTSEGVTPGQYRLLAKEGRLPSPGFK